MSWYFFALASFSGLGGFSAIFPLQNQRWTRERRAEDGDEHDGIG